MAECYCKEFTRLLPKQVCQNSLFSIIVQGIGVSIIRGTGRHTMGALILFISYYVFALPVGIALMFVTSLRVTGKLYDVT